MKPVAIQLYSLRDEMQNDVTATLKKVKALGYDGVEFAGLWGFTPEEMKNLLDEIGLVPVSAHISFYDLRADASKVIDEYKRAGCAHLVVPGLAPEDRPGTENWENTKAELNKYGEMVRNAGMTFSYHNHDTEFVRLENGSYGFDDLYDTVSAENLKMQMDCCWVSVAGEDPNKYLKKYANRCPLLHLKDYVGRKSDNMYALIGIDESEKERSEEFGFRSVGDGVVKFAEIIENAEKCGVEWYVVEQDMPTVGKTPFECAEMSIKYLRELRSPQK